MKICKCIVDKTTGWTEDYKGVRVCNNCGFKKSIKTYKIVLAGHGTCFRDGETVNLIRKHEGFGICENINGIIQIVKLTKLKNKDGKN
ncbi:MAG TPA: hypothetical protein VNG53_01035 [Bacteroidia bacterium]|nr:hypothetical protein [Bacteroidia bacterium]